MRGRHGFLKSMREIKMSKEKEMEKEKKHEKTDLERAAESFAKYRNPDVNFLKDYLQQSHNGPVTEEEEIEL